MENEKEREKFLSNIIFEKGKIENKKENKKLFSITIL